MAELEELRVQPQDILAEQSVLGAIFLDEGKITGIGTHEQLYKNHKLYQEYIKAQFPRDILKTKN